MNRKRHRKPLGYRKKLFSLICLAFLALFIIIFFIFPTFTFILFSAEPLSESENFKAVIHESTTPIQTTTKAERPKRLDGVIDPTLFEKFDFPYDGIRQLEVRCWVDKCENWKRFRDIIIIMSTSTRSDLRDLEKLMSSLGTHLEDHYLPLAIVHEDWDKSLQHKFQNLTMQPIYYVKVQFWVPNATVELLPQPYKVRHFTGHPGSSDGYHEHTHGLNKDNWNKRKDSYAFGYHHMCRFWTFPGLVLPFFQTFEYYMRLDTDSNCRRLDDNYFDLMRIKKWKYMFNLEKEDGGEVVDGLWNHATKFVEDNDWEDTWIYSKENRPHYPECDGKSRHGVGPTEVSTKNGLKTFPCEKDLFRTIPMFYTNFEVVDFKIFQSKRYRQWFEHVDALGGIYEFRWGDAPLRWLGLSMSVQRNETKKVTGCWHK